MNGTEVDVEVNSREQTQVSRLQDSELSSDVGEGMTRYGRLPFE